MIYMTVFWAITIVAIILYFILKNKFEKIALPMILLALPFLIVAIITRDPLFSRFGIPVEFEWIVGLFITGISSWKLYFNPLKERVIKTEKDVVSIKSDLEILKKDVSMIKEILMNKRPIKS